MVAIWRTSPRSIFIQAVGAILTALLPLATTYFAALTTTALAEAYTGGDPRQLFAYVVITVILGVIMSFWGIVQSYFEQLMHYQLESSINDQMFTRLHGLDFYRYKYRLVGSWVMDYFISWLVVGLAACCGYYPQWHYSISSVSFDVKLLAQKY